MERKGAVLYDQMVWKEDVRKNGCYVYELVRKDAMHVIEERVLCMSRKKGWYVYLIIRCHKANMCF